MKSPKVFQVDGEAYTVSPYPTSFGMKLLTELVLVAGEPLMQMALQIKNSGAGASGFLDRDIDPKVVTAIMGSLSSRLTPDSFDALVKKILSGTLVGTTSMLVTQDYEIRFSGRYLHLCKVLVQSLKGQYSDFLRPRRTRRVIPGGETNVKIPDHMAWEVWRVWLSGKATLHEIDTQWSLCDLMDANDALDIFEEMKWDADQAARVKR